MFHRCILSLVVSAVAAAEAWPKVNDSAEDLVDRTVEYQSQGELVHETTRRLDINSYEFVGDGDCVDFLGSAYNSIRVAMASSASVDECAVSCSVVESTFQVGFQFDALQDTCDCLYSAGNVPDIPSLEGAFTGADGIYGILSFIVSDSSCYRVKDINPSSINSLASYSTRSIDTLTPISDTCQFNPTHSEINCYLSYSELEGSMLYANILSGSCTDNSASITSPVNMIDSTKATIGSDTILVRGITTFTAQEKNSGVTKQFKFCIRADVYDLMSMASVLAKKLDVQVSTSFNTSGLFFTTGEIIVTLPEIGQESSSAIRNVTLTATQGACGSTDPPEPIGPGDAVYVCVSLEGADDARLALIKKLSLYEGGDELLSIIADGDVVWILTEYVSDEPTNETPQEEITLRVMFPSMIYDSIAAGGVVTLTGTAKIVYVSRRELYYKTQENRGLEEVLQEDRSFSLKIVLKKKELPRVTESFQSDAVVRKSATVLSLLWGIALAVFAQ